MARVLVIDRNAERRDNMRQLLDNIPGLEFMLADEIAAVVHVVDQMRPDVVLLGVGRVSITLNLLASFYPNTPVVAYTNLADPSLKREALKAGARQVMCHLILAKRIWPRSSRQ